MPSSFILKTKFIRCCDCEFWKPDPLNKKMGWCKWEGIIDYPYTTGVVHGCEIQTIRNIKAPHIPSKRHEEITKLNVGLSGSRNWPSIPQPMRFRKHLYYDRDGKSIWITGGERYPKKSGVYFFFDKERSLIYVGSSCRLNKRLAHHPCWEIAFSLSWVIINENNLLYAECFYIGVYCPTLNNMCPRSRFVDKNEK